MQYSFVDQSGHRSVSVFANGEVHVATDAHPRFEDILAGARSGDESVLALFDVSKEVAQRFERVSANGRVTVANGNVFFDGDLVDNSLTQQIIRFMEEGVEDFRPLVNFFEKVSDNPQAHSREQLFNWLSKRNFTITPEGDLVGYKGVRRDNDGKLVSISHGPAIVDGAKVNGAVPNEVGTVVEMARSNVHHDPAVGCSTGLHFGTWEYAKSFAQGAVVEVHANPRDIVSVPTDCDWQKVRACRYKVVKVIDVPYTAAVAYDEAFEEDDEDAWAECERCGDEADCCYEDLCDTCGDEETWEDEGDSEEEDFDFAVTATPWDTRFNYTKQERYPAGHPKAGQFVPRSAV